jgi:hypothetical protein
VYIMAPEPITAAYFIKLFHHSLCLYAYPFTVVRQRLGKNVIAATNTHATIEEFLNASLSMQSVSYQRKVGDKFFHNFLFFFLSPSFDNQSGTETDRWTDV